MPERRLHIAAYDVSHPRRLRRALRIVRGYATGGQKSVHECFLTAGEREQLLRDIRATLHADKDRFFLLRLDPRCGIEVLGIAEAPVDPPYFYLS